MLCALWSSGASTAWIAIHMAVKMAKAFLGCLTLQRNKPFTLP